jgi:hypothetical protein
MLIFNKCMLIKKGKVIPVQAWTGPKRFQEVGVPTFQENQHIKLVKLSAKALAAFAPQEIVLLDAESIPGL